VAIIKFRIDYNMTRGVDIVKFQNCTVCNKEKNDGLNILGKHICQECLNSISQIEINDIEYEYYLSVLRKTWIDYIVANKV